MTKQTVQGLLGNITEHCVSQPPSDEQKQLLDSVERHIHNWDEPDVPDPELKETFKMLLIEFEKDHPNIANTAEEIIEILTKMGL